MRLTFINRGHTWDYHEVDLIQAFKSSHLIKYRAQIPLLKTLIPVVVFLLIILRPRSRYFSADTSSCIEHKTLKRAQISLKVHIGDLGWFNLKLDHLSWLAILLWYFVPFRLKILLKSQLGWQHLGFPIDFRLHKDHIFSREDWWCYSHSIFKDLLCVLVHACIVKHLKSWLFKIAQKTWIILFERMGKLTKLLVQNFSALLNSILFLISILFIWEDLRIRFQLAYL